MTEENWVYNCSHQRQLLGFVFLARFPALFTLVTVPVPVATGVSM